MPLLLALPMLAVALAVKIVFPRACALLVGSRRQIQPDIPHAQVQEHADRYAGSRNAPAAGSQGIHDADRRLPAQDQPRRIAAPVVHPDGRHEFCGTSPALHNQADLIDCEPGPVFTGLVPGLTGWAQINGRDELPIPEKVVLDAEYLARQGFWFDIRIIWLTAIKVLKRDGVSHRSMPAE